MRFGRVLGTAAIVAVTGAFASGCAHTCGAHEATKTSKSESDSDAARRAEYAAMEAQRAAEEAKAAAQQNDEKIDRAFEKSQEK